MSQNSTAAVLAALAAGPADAAEIAERAGIGRSTASKALAALAGQGTVERTPGGREGGRRLADLWSTQGQSLPAFGLALLLGFDLLPRIRNWADLVFYLPEAQVCYRHIDALFARD